jgi:hypothetical protein
MSQQQTILQTSPTGDFIQTLQHQFKMVAQATLVIKDLDSLTSTAINMEQETTLEQNTVLKSFVAASHISDDFTRGIYSQADLVNSLF